MTYLPPPLRLAFAKTCRERNIDKVTGLREAIAEWTGCVLNHDSSGKPMGRPAQPHRRFSPLMVEAIRRLRAEREIAQKEIALSCGLNPAQLSFWLGGGAVPKSSRVSAGLEQLGAMAGVPTDEAFVTDLVSAAPDEIAA